MIQSDDGTAALARSRGRTGRGTAPFRFKPSQRFSPGWTGNFGRSTKESPPHPERPDFFWFTDADIMHAPDTLRRLVSRAETESLDLASLMVLLQAKIFPEKLLIPPFCIFS